MTLLNFLLKSSVSDLICGHVLRIIITNVIISAIFILPTLKSFYLALTVTAADSQNEEEEGVLPEKPVQNTVLRSCTVDRDLFLS